MNTQQKDNFLGTLIAIAIFIILFWVYTLTSSDKVSVYGKFINDLVPELAGAIFATLVIYFVFTNNDISLFVPAKQNLKNSGIIDFSSKMPNNLNDLIKNSTRKIKILQTWIDDRTNIYPDIKNAAKRDVEIKILILKESSKQTEYRARSLNKDTDDCKVNIRQTFSEISKLKEKYPKFQMIQYDDLISMSAYLIDDICLIGWYCRGDANNKEDSPDNRNTPYLIIKGENTEMYMEVNKHFDNMWNAAEISANTKQN